MKRIDRGINMFKKLLLVLTLTLSPVTFLGSVKTAHANDARKCISFITHANSVGIKNSCNSNVLFVFCDRKPCRGNGVISYYGSHTVLYAGQTQNLYSNRNNVKNVQWAACTVPKKGNVWQQITITNNQGNYRCGNNGGGNSNSNSSQAVNPKTARSLTNNEYTSLSHANKIIWLTRRKNESKIDMCVRISNPERSESVRKCICKAVDLKISSSHC